MKTETLTAKEFRALAQAQSSASGRRKNKYNARPVGGNASTKENRRARQLRLAQRAGLISDLREQVWYTLIPAQYGDCGVDLRGRPVRVLLEHSCRYRADFVYTDCATGQLVVEDTKGYRTPEYKIKRKLMLSVHGIRIKET